MEIRLLKSCMHGEKGDIIDMRPIFAKMLIKRGLAVKAESIFILSDLCFGEIAKVADFEDYQLYEGEQVSDIAFWLETKEYAVFIHHPPRFARNMFAGGDFYHQLSTGKKYLGDNCINNIVIRKGEEVVNHTSIKLLCFMDEELKSRGWDENTELTIDQIKQFEQDLNNKYKYFIGSTRYVR